MSMGRKRERQEVLFVEVESLVENLVQDSAAEQDERARMALPII